MYKHTDCNTHISPDTKVHAAVCRRLDDSSMSERSFDDQDHNDIACPSLAQVVARPSRFDDSSASDRAEDDDQLDHDVTSNASPTVAPLSTSTSDSFGRNDIFGNFLETCGHLFPWEQCSMCWCKEHFHVKETCRMCPEARDNMNNTDIEELSPSSDCNNTYVNTSEPYDMFDVSHCTTRFSSATISMARKDWCGLLKHIKHARCRRSAPPHGLPNAIWRIILGKLTKHSSLNKLTKQR